MPRLAVVRRIGFLRRNTHRRLYEQYMRKRRGRQRCQHLADPLGYRGTAEQAVRHIGSEPHTIGRELFRRQSETIQCVHRLKSRRAVTAAARKSCRDGNILCKTHLHSAGDALLLTDQVYRLIDQIIRCFPELHARIDCDLSVLRARKFKFVRHSHGLHDHPDQMVAVVSHADNIQSEIDLCVCFCDKLSHALPPAAVLFISDSVRKHAPGDIPRGLLKNILSCVFLSGHSGNPISHYFMLR